MSRPLCIQQGCQYRRGFIVKNHVRLACLACLFFRSFVRCSCWDQFCTNNVDGSYGPVGPGSPSDAEGRVVERVCSVVKPILHHVGVRWPSWSTQGSPMRLSWHLGCWAPGNPPRSRSRRSTRAPLGSSRSSKEAAPAETSCLSCSSRPLRWHNFGSTRLENELHGLEDQFKEVLVLVPCDGVDDVSRSMMDSSHA